VRIKIAQQMAYDSHVAESETYVFHAPPVLDPNTHYAALRSVPIRSRHARPSKSSAESMGSPLSSRLSRSIEDNWFDSIDITDTVHTPDASHDSFDFSVYAPALRTELAKHKNNITKLTLASFTRVGFSQEQIEATAIITGYSETQIVQALVALILPEKEAKKLGIVVNTIPAALIGGLRIVLAN